MESAAAIKDVIKKLKNSINVPFKELRVSSSLSFIIFEVGAEPYYIKVVS